MSVQRILFRFSKEGDASYLSHRDLMRLFERALRRAELPVRMTQGFNPHPKLSILLALPLGVEADEEAIEIEFEPPVAPAAALDRLRAQLPEGVRLTRAEALPPGARARVVAAAYEAQLPPDAPLTQGDLERLQARDAIPIERTSPKGRRTVDIRPALAALSLEGRTLRFELHVGQAALPRPTEIVAACLRRDDTELPGLRLRRTTLTLAIPSAPA